MKLRKYKSVYRHCYFDKNRLRQGQEIFKFKDNRNGPNHVWVDRHVWIVSYKNNNKNGLEIKIGGL